MDKDLGWNDFLLRSYDPQIGRFLQNDPYDQFASGYVGMGNDPGNLVDEDGGFGGPINGAGAIKKTFFEVAADGTVSMGIVASRTVSQSSSWGTRLLGLAQGVGGIVISAVGAAGGAATSWSGVGAVAGGALFVYGADVAGAGFRQMLSGRSETTLTNKAISGGLQAAGASPQAAQNTADGAGLLVQLAAGNEAAASRLTTPAQKLATTSQKLARTASSGSTGAATAMAGGTANTSTKLLPEAYSRFSRFEYHFSKHAAEFGAATKDAYYKRALSLLDSPVGGDVQGFTNSAGYTFRMNMRTGEFGVMRPDGVVETFYRRLSAPAKYWTEQVAKWNK